MGPNLFRYATTELSQDAFICWLLAWADKQWAWQDEGLNMLGLALVNMMLEMDGRPPVAVPVSVTVHRQLMRADIVAEVGDDIVILIEDKVNAGLNGDQLVRYRKRMADKFKGKHMVLVFLKTGDQSSYDEVTKAGYHLVLRQEVLQMLRSGKDRVSNSIYPDFLDNLEGREARVESYATSPVSVWTAEWDPWIGFYKRLQRDLSDGVQWDYVPNASGGFLGAWWHFKAWKDPITEIEHDVYVQIEQGPIVLQDRSQSARGGQGSATRSLAHTVNRSGTCDGS